MMAKDFAGTIKEFAANISEEDLSRLIMKFDQRLAGDMADVLNFYSVHKSLDYFLSNSKSSSELFSMCDQIEKALRQKYKEQYA
jgi:hypothetical protein